MLWIARSLVGHQTNIYDLIWSFNKDMLKRLQLLVFDSLHMPALKSLLWNSLVH